MKQVTITNNSSEKIEAKTDADRFCIIRSFKGHLDENFNTKKVTILNKAEAICIYEELGQWIRRGLK